MILPLTVVSLAQAESVGQHLGSKTLTRTTKKAPIFLWAGGPSLHVYLIALFYPFVVDDEWRVEECRKPKQRTLDEACVFQVPCLDFP